MRRSYGKRFFESSNDDKPLFPTGETKGDLIEYYGRIAGTMLTHVEGRPLTLVRCPDGIADDGCFYQKQAADHFPDWIGRIRVRKRSGGEQTLARADAAAALAYLADQGTVAFHVWSSREPALLCPDRLVFDFDPPASASFEAVCAAARACRDLLEELELRPFVKTSGSKGLHVVAAIDADADFETVRAFARAVARRLAERDPEALTTELRKEKRRGRIFVDVARNGYAQTAVAPYSVRPIPGAPISAPLEWDELSRTPDARRWTIHNVFRRLAQRDDPWSALGRDPASVRRAAKRLECG